MKRIDLIKEICQAHGPSGFEGPVKNFIRGHLKGMAEFSHDNLGSIICEKKGDKENPKIMIPGHIDEVGFMVNSITKNGYIKFIPLGGWWDQVLLAQKVIIKTTKGDITGIIGSTPPHLMDKKDHEKVFEKKNMFIDVGAKDRAEAESMGIQLGDPVVPDTEFHILGSTGRIMAKALDNRLGSALFMSLISSLQGVKHPNTIYGVGTVQEEVGLRGATTAANIIKPDICIVTEVAIATDMPGLEKEEPEVRLGEGPVLTLADASMIANRSFRDFVITTAKNEKIPLQFNTMMGGGTDGGAIHKFGPGVPSVVLSVPTRYIHSHYGIFEYSDFENALKLLESLIKQLDEEQVSAIKAGS